MLQTPKTGVLLVNLGTPDSPSVFDVGKYLRQFLMDGRVVDINPIGRFLLVNGIIVPFRSFKSAAVYKKVWTEQGSPLMVYGKQLAALLQSALGESYVVSLAMRYQSPSIADALKALQRPDIENIIVFPLFPQYASATTGSVHQEVMKQLGRWQLIPKVTFIDRYPDNAKMIGVFAELGRKYMNEHKFDHVIFSYHGLPQRQLRRADKECCQTNCCEPFTQRNRLCYRSQCVQTSRLLAAQLGLAESDYTISFQSRLGNDPWIQPYTEDVIRELVKQGKKSVLAFSPSFVADCLETIEEIGEEYKEVFEEEGGEHWQMVESLNTHPRWVEAVKQMIIEAN